MIPYFFSFIVGLLYVPNDFINSSDDMSLLNSETPYRTREGYIYLFLKRVLQSPPSKKKQSFLYDVPLEAYSCAASCILKGHTDDQYDIF